MKRMMFLLISVQFWTFAVYGNGLSALLTYCAFNTPDHKPYVETYISILGNTAVFKKNTSGKFQAAIEIGMLFTQNGTVKGFKKYILRSQESTDSLYRSSFIDQQRFNLNSGEYELELSILDKNAEGAKPIIKKEVVLVPFEKEEVALSDIEFVESYTPSTTETSLTKSGYEVIPYIASVYPQNMEKMCFYAEVYETDKLLPIASRFVMVYYIEDFDTKEKLSDFGGFLKCAPKQVNIALSEINIAKLPSGHYNLVVEIYGPENKMLTSKKRFFQRVNPIKMSPIALEKLDDDKLQSSFAGRFHNVDTLSDLLLSVRPICSDVEFDVIETDIKTKEIKTLQRRLLTFWLDQNPKDPQASFDAYSEQVIAVQHSFGTRLERGYNTDRGRIYLKYGQPSSRQIADKEPSSYPYEIWNYYRLKDGQTNRKFIFYNSDLVTNNYHLIHSDAVGEIHDDNWNMKLNRRNTPTNDFDQTQAPDHFGGNSVDDFDHPK
jgi:GWxTD domain-containing protein